MKNRARNLRKTQTNCEAKLWQSLRSRRFCNYKFRRQKVLGPYIVDFVCLKRGLIIELDGSQHMENKEYDTIRTQFLESFGFRVLRFWNNQLLEEFNAVLDAIYNALSCDPHPALRATFSRNGRR